VDDGVGVAHPAGFRFGYAAGMPMRVRKLIGTVILLLFLGLYAWAVAAIGAGRITLAPQWLQFSYFVAAGLLWVLPAGLLIRWMQRPD
jgi:hypothetical protein